jgi:hypothetical protein
MMTKVGLGFFIQEEEKERRLAICDQCPEKVIKKLPLTNIDSAFCNVCGCILTTRVHTTCPLGKWINK